MNTILNLLFFYSDHTRRAVAVVGETIRAILPEFKYTAHTQKVCRNRREGVSPVLVGATDVVRKAPALVEREIVNLFHITGRDKV